MTRRERRQAQAAANARKSNSAPQATVTANNAVPQAVVSVSIEAPPLSADEEKLIESALESCRQNECKSIDEFDKMVAFLAGGALSISFAFLKDIVNLSKASYTGMLTTAWLFCASALGLSLLAFYLSHLAQRIAQEAYYEYRRIRTKEALDRLLPAMGGGLCGKTILFINPIAGILTVVGIGLIAIFAVINVRSSPSTTKIHDQTITSTNAASTTAAQAFTTSTDAGTNADANAKTHSGAARRTINSDSSSTNSSHTNQEINSYERRN